LEKLADIDKTLRGKIGDVLRPNEPGIDDFDRRYGALQEMQDSARAKINSSETTRAGDNASIRSGGSGISVLERLHIKPSPGRLAQKAIGNFADSGVTPPPSVEPPAPTPAIPGVPGTIPPAQVAPPPEGEQPPPVPPQYSIEGVLGGNTNTRLAGNQGVATTPPPFSPLTSTETPSGRVAGLLPGPPAPFEPPAPMPPVPQVPTTGPGGNVAGFPDQPTGQAPNPASPQGEVPNWPPKVPDWAAPLGPPIGDANSTLPPNSPFAPPSPEIQQTLSGWGTGDVVPQPLPPVPSSQGAPPAPSAPAAPPAPGGSQPPISPEGEDLLNQMTRRAPGQSPTVKSLNRNILKRQKQGDTK
jgi:hypothetical protein